jgi:hypothetical protein
VRISAVGPGGRSTRWDYPVAPGREEDLLATEVDLGAETLNVRVLLVTFAPRASVTVTVTLNVPRAVGVQLRVAVLWAAHPGGSPVHE